jgi:4-alpha-glucanotransferase
MRSPRSSGVLLHPSSLPGSFGIGDLGPQAHRFVDFLAETGQRWWQVLPLGPTGGMNSPYQSHSSFAGNPLLISPEWIVEKGRLDRSSLEGPPGFPADHVDFRAVAKFKEGLLRRAFETARADDPAFQEFLAANAGWLEDYALFMALKDASDGLPWFEWEPELVTRKPATLARWKNRLADDVRYHQFVQFVFDVQIKDLRKACAEKGIGLIGDIPIFVAHDSADVWARPDLFFLDKRGRPTCVAGVPPDYFSATGQLWGNPLYRWDVHAADGYAWWIDRLCALLTQVDMIRIDHFRGFEAYWEVPGKAKTAAKGRWVPGPGAAFFQALQKRFANLPLIAEDLGLITPAVRALRDQFDLPGMRVLQFGFDTSAEAEEYLPHRYVPHCVAYTGTHDNDTAVGWMTSSHVQTTQSTATVRAERAYALRYAGSNGKEFHWDMIRLALASIADIAILPMQDILGLDSRARMNVPGKAEGNWAWRFLAQQLRPKTKSKLADLTAVYSRWNGTPPNELDPHFVPAATSTSSQHNSEQRPRKTAMTETPPKPGRFERDGDAREKSRPPQGTGAGKARPVKGK